MTSVAEPKQLGDHIISLVKPLDTNKIGKALYDLCDMADSFRCQEAWEEALECCRMGHKLISEMAGRTSRNIDIDCCEGIVLLYEGTIYLSQGKNQAAEDCFRRSADTHSRIDLRNEGIAWLGLGITFESKGDLTRALEAYQLSLNAFNDLTGNRGSIRIEAVSRLERARDRLQSDLEKRMKSRGSKQQKRISKTTPLLRLIPLCGDSAAAGEALTVRDNIIDYLSASEFQIGRETLALRVIQGTSNEPHVGIINFAMKVTGESMKPTIQDGEYVLVRKKEQVENGEIAVVRFRRDVGTEELQATVKRYYREKDHILLQPDNEDAKWTVFVGKKNEDTVKNRYRDQLEAGKLEILTDLEPHIEGEVVGVLKRKEVE